ncbi:hypothetical protein GMLC_33230 [Geomonas limicola]|uniref:Uncharacterized protein n=1 Tax=Geomonas limicola TaxID=2740186 RepID=A0A6V8NCY9_9BACT|nr:hypothetical protein GMLC_33230 [Geomonas limicola]
MGIEGDGSGVAKLGAQGPSVGDGSAEARDGEEAGRGIGGGGGAILPLIAGQSAKVRADHQENRIAAELARQRTALVRRPGRP